MEINFQVMQKYKSAMQKNDAGRTLMKRSDAIMDLDCSDEKKSRCFQQEIDNIIGAFILHHIMDDHL